MLHTGIGRQALVEQKDYATIVKSDQIIVTILVSHCVSFLLIGEKIFKTVHIPF